ncbi:MAG: lipid II:glycine glycyltransferase FemX [Betaproteobacteria bacterium]
MTAVDGAHGGLRPTEVDFHRDARWEQFVDAHPDALIFHHPAWLQVLERESGRRCISLACEDREGRLHAVLPLFSTRGLPFGLGGQMGTRRLSSLPRTPVAGTLSLGPEAAALLIREAVRRVDARAGQHLQIKAADRRLDGVVDGVVRQPWRLSYGVMLPEQRRQLGEEECRSRFGPCDTCRVLRFGNCDNHRHVTWAVKKARSQDVVVEESASASDIDAWYPIYLETMRRNFVPARSLSLFHACWDLLRPRGFMRLLIARRQGSDRMIGGTILLTYRDDTFAAFAASRESDFSLHPNDILHWVGIHDACRQGCRIYDFGEVPGDAPNLARFKRKWNCAETELSRYSYPAAPVRTEDGVHGAARMLAARVWTHVPLKATAMVGGWIYRYL